MDQEKDIFTNGAQADGQQEELEQFEIPGFGEEKKAPYPPAEFDVRMEDKFIFDMLLYHMYSTLGGFCINIAGLTAMVLGGMRYHFGQLTLAQAFGWIIVGIIIVAFTPLSLKSRAKNTVKLGKYQGPIHYVFSNSGIDETLHDGGSNHYDWSLVAKAVNTPKTIAFYLEGSGSVLVFPKEQFSNATFQAAMWYLGHNVVMGKIYIH